MSDWTEGYMADIAYTFGYYSDLNPLQAQLAFLNAGLAAPKRGVACELGFGQGLSTNIHAATSGTTWWATDFNPAQATFAQQLAQVSGAPAHLFDESFAQFCQRTDLPDFDFIGVHGIWSWISEENRAMIVDFLSRKLKVGGVLYISYNVLPGWNVMAPMRHLMTEHAAVMSAPGQGIASRIDAAIEFSEKMMEVDPAYIRVHPSVPERMARLQGQPRSYLAHEYFNRDWQPMHFSDMAKCLAPAKLNFACSADYIDHVPAVRLTIEQQAFLDAIADPVFRQTVRGYLVNEQFRRDYWVKGGCTISPVEQMETLRRQKVLLITPPCDVTLKTKGNFLDNVLPQSAYAPIIDALQERQPMTLAQLEEKLTRFGIEFFQLRQAIFILIGHGHVLAVQDDASIAAARPATEKLNQYLLDKARSHGEITYLASAVTGGGIMIDRIHQLFLLAIAKGHQTPHDWMSFVWQILRIERQAALEGSQATPSKDTDINTAVLIQQAKIFEAKFLPILKTLGITPE